MLNEILHERKRICIKDNNQLLFYYSIGIGFLKHIYWALICRKKISVITNLKHNLIDVHPVIAIITHMQHKSIYAFI